MLREQENERPLCTGMKLQLLLSVSRTSSYSYCALECFLSKKEEIEALEAIYGDAVAQVSHSDAEAVTITLSDGDVRLGELKVNTWGGMLLYFDPYLNQC